ncbi:DUF1289 domain-containing protein [Minwuia thermotolerans]|jgi:hypothetical protein|uniref:DUF1289 domain-containing protein n=1 Tax=Minwuia thermotolerans TaxID=2056226 RepID=A0A2M9FVS2_9PROT|nr:DUF1289 domain-containing protein [Minwuia thermotolerans]ANK83586.1 MAG: hypothetical protein TEF_17930 [Rhizobiales bacterium NRL2]PJK27568.1 DUF1289 domain-containing protein [Minwuia thermotolerans]
MSDDTPAIPSPCISVCKLNPGRDYCLGCYRSRAEIAEWRKVDDDRRREILESAGARRVEIVSRSISAPRR